MAAIQIQNYINGAFVPTPAGAPVVESINPATGKAIGDMPDSGADQVSAAVAAAKAAFPAWSQLPRAERAAWLNKIADAIEQRLDEFALLESTDQGKPLWLAKSVDIPRAVYNFRFFAGAILYATNSSTMLEGANAVNYTTHTPVGVAGLISPWNLPLYLLTWKIAPALATGNTAVVKPSEVTSMTAFRLAQVMHELGVPAGVCNFVFGLGATAGSALVTHPDVPLISFTGGTVTGDRIRVLAAPFGKKLSLELGGKNPALVFASADLTTVVPKLVRASFTNQGEICLCASRIYVQRPVFDAFVAAYVAGARAITVGPPSDPASRMGALVSKQHWEKVASYVQLARSEGAMVHCGHTVDPPPELPAEYAGGYFMRPTVLTKVAQSSACIQEEIFGPVVSILPFDTEAEAIALANDSQYGLSATIWGTDGAQCTRVAHALHTGTVWINCWMLRDLNMPFGGVKGSGTGRESAEDSLRFFTEAKTICTKFA